MKKQLGTLARVLLSFTMLLVASGGFAQAGADVVHIAVLSDLHLPGRILPQKERVVETLNAWPDLDMVVALGDICEDVGSVEEYAFAKQFLARLKKPVWPVAGNHDYIYYDINPFTPNEKIPKGKHVVAASAGARRAKLQRFKESFGLPEVYYAKQAGPYRLVFLSTDHLYLSYRTAVSEAQLEWLGAELARHRAAPTIVFFHGPLEGTIGGENLVDNDPFNYMAQPSREIRRILLENPQVFMWVAGHAHIAPANANFNGPLALYERRVAVIHCPGMSGSSYLSETDKKGTRHEALWTRSLFLHPDRVVVKTFDHEKGAWMESLTREVKK